MEICRDGMGKIDGQKVTLNVFVAEMEFNVVNVGFNKNYGTEMKVYISLMEMFMNHESFHTI